MVRSWEPFTARARQSIILANEVARERGYDRIGSEHLLLGLTLEKQNLAAQSLIELGVSSQKVSVFVQTLPAFAQSKAYRQIPFTDNAIRVIHGAFAEAERLRHSYIGSEHLLLSIARERGCSGFVILEKFGVDYSKLRKTIFSLNVSDADTAPVS